MTDELVKFAFETTTEALSQCAEIAGNIYHHEVIPVAKMVRLSYMLQELTKKLGKGPESEKAKKVLEAFDTQQKKLLISKVDVETLKDRWRKAHPDEDEVPSEEDLYYWAKSNELIVG